MSVGDMPPLDRWHDDDLLALQAFDVAVSVYGDKLELQRQWVEWLKSATVEDFTAAQARARARARARRLETA
jgi:hypothetical protein